MLRKTCIATELTRGLEVAVNTIFSDLQDMNPLGLDISEYNQRYLKGLLKTFAAVGREISQPH